MARGSRSRGEIWRINLDPTIGSEIQKIRPAVVVSAPVFDNLPIRIIVPLTSWQQKFASHLNKVRVAATPQNGLASDSAADVLQVRCVSIERFVSKLGVLEATLVDEITAGIAVAVDYQPG
jgi:mRNA interferase MazF